MAGDDTSKGGGKTRHNSANPPAEFAPSGGAGDDPLTRNLKKVYAEVAAEPIPDRLMRLLDRLDEKSKSDGDHG